MITKWSKEEIEEFCVWHEKRIAECGYPESVCQTLRQNRETWLLSVRT